jgi:tRNA-dihydrouridine synthase
MSTLQRFVLMWFVSTVRALQTTQAPPLVLGDQIIKSVAAPMVAASDYAFRCLCRQYGVDLTYTQMLHAKNIVRDPIFVRNHLDFYECGIVEQKLVASQQLILKDTTVRPPLPSVTATKGPLIVQLAGNDPTLVAQAAQKVFNLHPQIAGFDLNCGCPQAIARKGNYGSFLMEHDNGKTVCDIVRSLRQAVPVPISVKHRLATDPSQNISRWRALQEAGVCFITVHGRTLYENKTAVGPCHVEWIQKAVETLSIPVVANGGVERFQDVEQLLQNTGASAVMSSEGLLETPYLFRDDPVNVKDAQFQVTRDHLAWCIHFPPLPGVLGPRGSMTVVKGHVFKFLHRYWSQHEDLRDRLTDPSVDTLGQLEDVVDELWARVSEQDDCESVSWYRRHRKQRIKVEQVSVVLSADERKAQIRERIDQMRKDQKNVLRLSA